MQIRLGIESELGRFTLYSNQVRPYAICIIVNSKLRMQVSEQLNG